MQKYSAHLSGAKRWLAASTIAVSAALALGPLAVAQTITGEVSGLDPVTAAAACQNGASLTVSLVGHNPYDDVPAGEKAPGGVKDYSVLIRRVQDVDLGTAEGWAVLKDLTPEAAAKHPLAPAVQGWTDKNGVVDFKDVQVGLYLLTVEPPADADHSYKTYKPQLVTVPVGMPGTPGVKAGWNCHPVITPKSVEVVPPTPTTTPPTLTKPAEPTEPSTPQVPSEPTPPVTPDSPTPGGGGSLASTGVNILGALLLGAGLIGIGIVLKRRRSNGS